MTYASIELGHAHSRAWTWKANDYGASQDAFDLRQTFGKLKEHFTKAATGQRREERLNASLEALLATIAEPVEYQEESQQASAKTIREAALFIQGLPEGIPQPDIIYEPSGAIAFEWYKDKQNVFVISTKGVDSLEYAALFGPGNEMHGRMNFAGDVPPKLSELLSVFCQSPSSL